MSGLRPVLTGSGVLAGMCLIWASALSAAPPAASSPAPAAPPSAPDAVRSGLVSSLVEVHELEAGKNLFLEVNTPGLHLVKAPHVASVTEKTARGLSVRAQALGETLILVWYSGGIRTFRIRVVRPSPEQKRIESIQTRASELYRSRQERSFRVKYRTEYSLFSEGRVLGRISETRKTLDHGVEVTGATPWGQFDSGLLYEYRKESSLEKSVAVPRNFYAGLRETNLPLLQNYDIYAGSRFVRLGNFGMSGDRIHGLVLSPSRKRAESPAPGQIDLHAFVGQRRDGSLVDNPPGSQNRELEGKLAGHKLDLHLWKGGRLSAGSYHRWSGPRGSLESRRNFDLQFVLPLGFLVLNGEGGIDDRSHLAGQLGALIENRVMRIQGRWFQVDNHYRTVTGSALDRGNRGWELKTDFYPLAPWGGRNRLALSTDARWVRNHLSVNPARPDEFVKTLRQRVRTTLPFGLVSETSVFYQDQKASSFPFVEKELRQLFKKEYSLNRFLLKRVRLFVSGGVESFRDSVDAPGFNSTRFQAGGGGSIHFKGGLWLSAEYLWNRLKEEDLPAPPRDVTYPRQVTVAGGWAHAFQRFPMNVYLDLRYIDEGSTHDKIHQPFLNEDRFEARGGVSYSLRDLGEIFMQARTTITNSTTGRPDEAELSLYGGMKLDWDTGWTLPQNGAVEGYVFYDANANGELDEDENGLEGFQVRLDDGSVTTSAADGYFRFETREGLRRLTGPAKLPPGYFYTTVSEKGFEILPGKVRRQNFGMAPQLQLKGSVFIDLNSNGLLDASDFPVQGVRVALATGQSGMSTNAGVYSILRVPPGENRARVILSSLPHGYRTVTPVEKNFSGEAGDISHFNVILQPERILSGTVFLDGNRNHRQDPDEKGIAGVEVRVQGRQFRTNTRGRFLFGGLEPGPARIEVLPGGDYSLNSGQTRFEIARKAWRQDNVELGLIPASEPG